MLVRFTPSTKDTLVIQPAHDAGVNVTSRLSLHAQFDTSSLELPPGPPRAFPVGSYYEDLDPGRHLRGRA